MLTEEQVQRLFMPCVFDSMKGGYHMKRIIVSLAIVVCCSLALIGVNAEKVTNETESSKNMTCFVEYTGEPVQLEPVHDEVIDMETGIEYKSFDEYMEKVGNMLKEQYPDISFYEKHVLTDGTTYIFSNKTPNEVFEKNSEYIASVSKN